MKQLIPIVLVSGLLVLLVFLLRKQSIRENHGGGGGGGGHGGGHGGGGHGWGGGGYSRGWNSGVGWGYPYYAVYPSYYPEIPSCDKDMIAKVCPEECKKGNYECQACFQKYC
jgi:hypothetical protein